ncbi:Iron-regulated outer membrane proteins [Sphingobacterium spiritivorum]|nr:TonB-dependent receptor [Sphingobacterium spiritivorum]SUJ14669.1 Iron-regulated outer membrane proteins [Sphingobacterium spiritivorum]
MSLPLSKLQVRFFRCSLLCLVIFQLNHTIAQAQSIQLLVRDESKRPLPHATVYLNKKATGSTTRDGSFNIPRQSSDTFQLTVSSLGYQTYTGILRTDTLSNPFIITLKDSRSLDEVVVTAGRKAESIDEIPSSVSILTRKEIEAQINITSNLASILGNTIPGLGTSNNKSTNSGQTLRGRAVLVLIDGIPQSTPLMNGSRDLRTIDPGVIERIEVIKGATSIYGNGSGGGIINYITKKNTDNVPLSGQTFAGTSFNPVHPGQTLGYRFAQMFSGRSNKFSYTVSGSADYTGLQRDGKGLPIGQQDGIANSYQYNAFIKLGYDLDSNTSISAFYNLYNSTQHTRYINQAGVYGESQAIGVRGEEPGENAGTPYNHNIMVNLTKRNLFGQTQLDLSGYYNSFSSMNRYVPSGTAWYGPGQTKINSEKKGVRINLNTPFRIGNNPTEVTYGLDLLNDVTNQNLTDGRIYIPDMNMVNFAPYAQLKMDVLENLIFKGGVRYENATVKVKDFNTIATGPDGQGSIAVSGGKIPYKASMFNAGLRYTKYDIFNPFVSFSQGFAINELGRILRRAKANTLDQLETDPIITNNYEVGFSSQYNWLHLSAAYYISTSKLGVNLVDVGGFLVAQREPENVKGYELAAEARLSPKWTLGANYAFVEGKAKFDDGRKVYLNGSRIAPPKATAYVYYRPASQWNLQLFWVHTGSRDRFPLNDKGKYNNSEGPIKPVDLFNLSAAYTINTQWSLGLGVENLFNTTYYPTVSQYRAIDAEYARGNGMQANINIHYKF